MSQTSTQFKGLEGRILRTLEESPIRPTPAELARTYRIGKAKVKEAIVNLIQAGIVTCGDEADSIGDNDPVDLQNSTPPPTPEPAEEEVAEEEVAEEPSSRYDVPRRKGGRKALLEIELRDYTDDELAAMSPEERKALKRAKRQARRRAKRHNITLNQ